MKALIIGAGNMGALYDSPNTEEVLSHAHAFYLLNNDIKDFAFCDPDAENLKMAMGRWGKVGYSDIKEALSVFEPDLVSICVSTNVHLKILKEVVLFDKVKTIILEKPSGKNLSEALEIQKLAKNYNKQIVVNFSRNFTEGIERLKNDIGQNKFGALQHINGLYTKGLLNNCSHLLSILCLLWAKVEFVGKDKSLIDYNTDDPTVTFRLEVDGVLCYVAGLSELNYSHFELDFFFEKARVKMARFGFDLHITYVEEDKIFGPKYKTLGQESSNSLGLEHSLTRLVTNIINNEDNSWSMENCIKVHQLIDIIK